MAFINWLGNLIGNIAADRLEKRLESWHEQKTKINAVTTEAKELMGELDNAQSDSERQAIMRKIAGFSDLKHLL